MSETPEAPGRITVCRLSKNYNWHCPLKIFASYKLQVAAFGMGQLFHTVISHHANSVPRQIFLPFIVILIPPKSRGDVNPMLQTQKRCGCHAALTTAFSENRSVKSSAGVQYLMLPFTGHQLV